MHIKLKAIYQFLISARMVFFLMPPLMLLLISGTVVQKELGLYLASKYFFAGPVSWFLLGILALSLTLKFLFDSEWSWQKFGIILSHLGILVLLYGGGLTALTNKEGYLIIPEGLQSATVLDYHQRSLVLLKQGNIVAEWPHDLLKKKGILLHDGAPDIVIKDFCLNCDIRTRLEPLDNAFGMAEKVMLKPKRSELNDEANISGLTFEVNGLQYILFEGFAKVLELDGYELIYGKSQRRLPFSVELVDFQKTTYSGTQMAKAYSSDIIVHDQNVNWPVRIEMNEPLRYKGYTLFQSNYIERPDGPDSTILAVVENKGWIFPYVGTLILAIGLLYHMFMHMAARVKRVASVALIGLVCCLSSNAAIAKPLDFDGLSTLPVLHEGRVKPLDSFARIYLKRFSGRESVDDQPAIVWLSEMLFDPMRAPQRQIFRVIHPELRAQLGVNDDDGRLFSMERLTKFLTETAPQVNELSNQDPKNLSTAQAALLDLHEDALAFLQILRSFSLVMPLNVSVPDDMSDEFADTHPVTFLGLLPFENQIIERSKQIVAQKKDDWESYSEEEGRYISLGFTQDLIRQQNYSNELFRVMTVLNDGGSDWLSPWNMISSGGGSPVNQRILSGWSELVMSYQSQAPEAWSKAVGEIQVLYQESIELDENVLQVETFYNSWPLGGSLLFIYALAVILLLLSLLKTKSSQKVLFASGLALSVLGVIIHSTMIGARIYILDRPPVGTLYESILFVALIACLVAILIDLKQRRGFALISGLFTSLILLAIAPSFVMDGESMDVLVAVLNTSFWLTTHVLCITIGYGLCILAAFCAHIYLFRRAFGSASGDKLFATLYRLSIAALFFTAFGTVLGGIWADQSWGRFWGWDPKENGALLIVLWLVWALHGRYASILSPAWYSATVAYLNVIVTLSWFGVNLLSVGLHSYGFISGIAYGILAVTLIETVLITGLLMKIKQTPKLKV